LALYVFFIGVQRFRLLHLSQKTVFRWKRHVILGEIALGTLLGGMLGGMTMVYVYWHGLLITGTHGKVALIMAPFIIFSGASGLYMNRNKKKRKALPLIHGLSNLVLLIFALIQVLSGWWVYRVFVLGR
jgi:nitric oxide reductase large subunit